MLRPRSTLPAVLTLKQYSLDCLCQHRNLIGTLGYVDTDSAKLILAGCTAEQLGHIEDMTRQIHGRDLSWYTWQFWHRHYTQKIGPIPPMLELPQLEDDPPCDYVPPVTNPPNIPAADYRTLYEQRTEKEAMLQERLKRRLRERYEEEEMNRRDKQTQACQGMGSEKRRRVVATSSHLPSHHSNTNKNKMMKEIGLGKKKPNSMVSVKTSSYSPGVSSRSMGVATYSPLGAQGNRLSPQVPGRQQSPLPSNQSQRSRLSCGQSERHGSYDSLASNGSTYSRDVGRAGGGRGASPLGKQSKLQSMDDEDLWGDQPARVKKPLEGSGKQRGGSTGGGLVRRQGAGYY